MIFGRRQRKQAAYALGFVIIVGGIIGGLALLQASPGGEVPTPLPTSAFLPVREEAVVLLPHTDTRGRLFADVVIQLRNPNPRAGISEYPVAIRILGVNGEELASKQEATHILPGALQYVVALEVPIPPSSTIGQVVTELPADPMWQELPMELSAPAFNTFLRERVVRQVGEATVETQTGLVKNTGTFDWEKVEVVAVGLNSNRQIIAAGKTFLGRLLAGEQREFTVEWPQTNQPISQVIALPSTDMFSEANIIDILGDPSSLR